MPLHHLQLSLKASEVELKDTKHQRGGQSESSEGGFCCCLTKGTQCCCCSTREKRGGGVQCCPGGANSKIGRKGVMGSLGLH